MKLSKSVQDKIDAHEKTWTTEEIYGYERYMPNSMPEDMIELDNKIENLRDILYQCEHNYIKLAKTKAIEYLELTNEYYNLEFDFSWGCPGELGYCVYNSYEDPCLDSCLICHQPQERK